MLIFGVDPGSISGAYAVLDTDTGAALVADLPVVDRNVDAAQLARIVREVSPDEAVVERVSAMPGQGVSSVWAFGRSTGLIQGVLLGCGVPVALVTPSVWKRAFNLNKDKERSRELAIRLFPTVEGLNLKKHAGRAEALLLARYLADKAK